MGEQQEVIADLRAAGVLAGIRWAYGAATRRSLEMYCEADGLDQAWLGNTRFTLFRDRLDRVFASHRYTVYAADGTRDTGILHAELSDYDVHTMPVIPPGTVRRADLRGSAGWACRQRRFLIASAEYGRLDALPWQEKSYTKQLVALQRSPDHRQPSLFEELDESEELDGAAEAAAVEAEAGGPLATFVVAHTLDSKSAAFELAFGRPLLNPGGPAWYWREDLLDEPLPGVRPAADSAPAVIAETRVPDALVRLRRLEAGRPDSGRPGAGSRDTGRPEAGRRDTAR
jgi:hypothetical protein